MRKRDTIREAIELLKHMDPGTLLEDVQKARALLVEAEERLPFMCSICGRYGCTHDHGY